MHFEVPMALPEIASDPAIMLGKPVIAGTRITVELLLEKLAAGQSQAQIERAHPHLPAKSIEAAITYAASLVRNEVIVPVQRKSA
jgi:uncharacterized protein (DUF433 family)